MFLTLKIRQAITQSPFGVATSSLDTLCFSIRNYFLWMIGWFFFSFQESRQERVNSWQDFAKGGKAKKAKKRKAEKAAKPFKPPKVRMEQRWLEYGELLIIKFPDFYGIVPLKKTLDWAVGCWYWRILNRIDFLRIELCQKLLKLPLVL